MDRRMKEQDEWRLIVRKKKRKGIRIRVMRER